MLFLFEKLFDVKVGKNVFDIFILLENGKNKFVSMMEKHVLFLFFLKYK